MEVSFLASLQLSSTVQASGADELSRLVTEEGYRGVRFNPYLWPEDETMTNDLGREMYKRCLS